jgi:hypothetical protein
VSSSSTAQNPDAVARVGSVASDSLPRFGDGTTGIDVVIVVPFELVLVGAGGRHSSGRGGEIPGRSPRPGGRSQQGLLGIGVA